MIAFLSILFVLFVIFLWAQSAAEGFQAAKTVPVPVALPLPDSKGPVAPYQLPGEIPNAPYQQIAAMSPLPYQDTTLVKANKQQIQSLLEMLKGFLGFEAQHIADRSDPSIQLPLSTARSDLRTLQSSADVLVRNPGIQSNITMSQWSEISSNLAYLQEKVRTMVNASGTPEAPKELLEGFAAAPAAAPAQGPPATMQDLSAFQSRIQGEILRLSASGTTDPSVQARVGALTKMQNDIQTIIDKVNQGVLREIDIPILKSDLDKAFPVLGKPSEPLPQILKAAKLPAGLANALPSNLQKDPETTRLIGDMVDKYAKQFLQGVKASFHVEYAPVVATVPSSVDKTGFPSATDLASVGGAAFQMAPQPKITDPFAPTPMDAGRGPSHFDWEGRAKEIEAQITKRGLDPKDYGVMPKGTKISKEFSWRGYTRMMCTRLQADIDPAMPETCGCPPLDWAGWRETLRTAA
jgi:hypothetical protein